MAHVTHHMTHQKGEFRSQTERQVAQELWNHSIAYTYEHPVDWPADVSTPYLPDFYIHPDQQLFNALSPEPLTLPRWIEVKPREMIEAARDDLGVTRRWGPKFHGTVEVPDVDAAMLREHGFAELYKPKRLAEIMGETVWVVGGVGGYERLSMTMLPTGVEFNRDNWFVNWPGYKQRIEREERRRQYEADQAAWEATRAQREIEAEQRRIAQQEESAREHAAAWKVIKSYPVIMSNKYDKACWHCDELVGARQGNLRKIDLVNGEHRWITTCVQCETRT